MNRVETKFLLPVCIFSIFLIFSLPSCTHDPVGLDNLDTVCFNTEILPILQSSCGMVGCHDGSAEGFLASDYPSIMQSVTPGDPRGSALYKSIVDINGENMMPPGRPLSKEQRTLIHLWIAQGAMNKQCNNNSGGGGGGGGGGNNDSLCFVQQILPLFVSKCASCHDGTSQGDDDVHALNSYATIITHVSPFHPNLSSVYRAVTGSGEDLMPPSPNAPLTSDEKERMRKWITEGALNSDCPSAACDTSGTISFSSQINPILQSDCVGCHNGSSSGGSINLSSYSQVINNTQPVSGHPRIIGAVKKLSGFRAMPPSYALDQCTIRKMELWISQGAANN